MDRFRWIPVAVAVVIAALLAAGCTRRYYRTSADLEGVRLVDEKSRYPRWELYGLNVYSDPRSRIFDPYNPDKEPLPPDDPAAHLFMHRVYHMRGYHKWHKNGDTTVVTNPMWDVLLPTYAPFTPEGKLKLDLRSATLLARIHSPDYQRNLEEVFLSALDVAFERFRFDVQFFLTNVSREFTQGGLPPAVLGALGPGFANSQTITSTQTNSFFAKRFATGADLLVSAANSMVWQFAGANTNFATSLISGSVIQPILRNGGKVIALEQLTRVERTLLNNMRSMALYKQQFFRNLAVGGGTDVAPRRIGGFQGGAGLTGFTGIGVGGFGGVGAGLNFGGFSEGRVGGSGAGAGTGLAGGGEGTVSGFYGLCQRLQQIRNTEASLAAQIQALGLLEANFDAGLIDLVQVDEFRQNIETERALLLRNQVALTDNIEFYLIDSIGLPPWIPVELDDSLIRPFQFIDPALSRLQTDASNLLARIGRLPARPGREEVEAVANGVGDLVDQAPRHVELLEREITDLEARRGDVPEEGGERQEYLVDLRQIRAIVDGLRIRMEDSRQRAEKLRAQSRTGDPQEIANQTVNVLRVYSTQLQELALLQAGVRVDLIVVKPVKLRDDEAYWIARNYRLDWMNFRTSLVDQWRLIAFNANRLLAGFDIEIDAELGTNGDNPARLRSPTGNMQARLRFDAPITRRSERNLYRQSLIDYQRVRRAYIGFMDQVNLQLRSRLRQIERLHENLEIQRRALAISIRRVDQTLEDLNRPFAPSEPGQPPQQLGPTLAQNLLRALSDFRNTQDNFMSVWMNVQSARMNLLIDLGLMQLDEEGMWVDQEIDVAAAAALAETPMPILKADPCEEFLSGLDDLYAFGGGSEGLVKLTSCHRRCWSPMPFLEADVEQWVVEAELAEPPGLPWMDLQRQAQFYEEDVQFPYPSPKTRFRDGRVFAQWTYWWYEFWPLHRALKSDRRIRNSIRREDFMTNLKKVGDLVAAGECVEDISVKTGLEEPLVKAYLEAVRRGDLPVIQTIPTTRYSGRTESLPAAASPPAAESGPKTIPVADAKGQGR